MQAALHTGCRYGELIRARVADFNADAGTLTIGQSKAGHPRKVLLTGIGATFLNELTAGRPGDALLFEKASGAAWGTSHQARPTALACKRASIRPTASFHTLRHTYASHAAMRGMPLLASGRNLGHTDTRMVEKHYGHLANDYLRDAVREFGPQLGALPATNVARLISPP